MHHLLLLVLAALGTSQPALSRLFVATSAGPFKSFSWGEHWEPLEPGLPKGTQAFLCLGPLAFAGGGEGLFRSDDFGETWRAVSVWSGGEIATFAASSLFPHESTIFAGTRAGLYRSRDSGDRWERIASGTIEGAVSQILWAGPSLFVAASDGLRLSEDGGDTWRRLEKGVPDAAVLSIALSQYFGIDPVGFIGTAGRGLYRTRDGAQSFHPVGPAGPRGKASWESRHVYAIFWWGESLFAGTDAGLFLSKDAGETWTSAGALLDGVRILTIAVPAAEAGGPSDVLVGTERGVFKSSDGALTWRPLDYKIGTPAIFGFGFFPFPKQDSPPRRRR